MPKNASNRHIKIEKILIRGLHPEIKAFVIGTNSHKNCLLHVSKANSSKLEMYSLSLHTVNDPQIAKTHNCLDLSNTNGLQTEGDQKKKLIDDQILRYSYTH